MCLDTMVLTVNGNPNSPSEVKVIRGDEGTSDLIHPSFLPLPQTMVSKVIEVHYPWHLRCHPSLTIQMGLDILGKAGGIERRCI